MHFLLGEYINRIFFAVYAQQYRKKLPSHGLFLPLYIYRSPRCAAFRAEACNSKLIRRICKWELHCTGTQRLLQAARYNFRYTGSFPLPLPIKKGRFRKRFEIVQHFVERGIPHWKNVATSSASGMVGLNFSPTSYRRGWKHLFKLWTLPSTSSASEGKGRRPSPWPHSNYDCILNVSSFVFCIYYFTNFLLYTVDFRSYGQEVKP